jgi:hypothetical protein
MDDGRRRGIVVLGDADEDPEDSGGSAQADQAGPDLVAWRPDLMLITGSLIIESLLIGDWRSLIEDAPS